MTDSSSDVQQAEMLNELLHAKMDSARSQGQMTHVMRVGTFHMEIVPDKDIDIAQVFKEVMDDLYEKFGDKLIAEPEGEQRHYG